VLFLAAGDAATRSAVDWVAEHQSDCDVVLAPRALAGRPIGRLEHAPFRPPGVAESALAAEAAGHLAAAGTPDHLAPRAAQQAAVLAILLRAPLLVSGQEAFRDLIPLSSWSMNVPSAPPDAALVRTLTTAGDAVTQAPGPDTVLFERLIAADERRLVAMVRERRRAARTLGPDLFRRVAPRSAGLRGFAVSLDLVPAFAANADARRWLAGLDRERGPALLGGAPAVFI
jgi:hypothetical protein